MENVLLGYCEKNFAGTIMFYVWKRRNYAGKTGFHYVNYHAAAGSGERVRVGVEGVPVGFLGVSVGFPSPKPLHPEFRISGENPFDMFGSESYPCVGAPHNTPPTPNTFRRYCGQSVFASSLGE